MPLKLEEGVQYLTIQEVADKLGVQRQRIYQLISDGILPADKLGRDWLVKEESVDEYLKIRRPVGYPRGKIRRELQPGEEAVPKYKYRARGKSAQKQGPTTEEGQKPEEEAEE